MIKDKFTPLEIQEVEDLAKVMSRETIASHFNITTYVFNSSFDKISPVTQNELIQNSMIYR